MDPTGPIAARVQRLKTLFASGFASAGGPYRAVAGPRFTLGVKLYYRMMERLLNNVSTILYTPDIEDRGHIVFVLFFCVSVCLSSTLTKARFLLLSLLNCALLLLTWFKGSYKSVRCFVLAVVCSL